MTVPADKSRIFISSLPSLSHLATVKVSLSLCNDFSEMPLRIAILTIRDGYSLNCFENSECPRQVESKRAVKKLLSIPVHLRKAVFEAVNGLLRAAEKWQNEHRDIPEVKECIFYYKSDGRIDCSETVQQLVLNENIDIRKRFILACKYCLEESIRNLWTEMKLSGKTENLETALPMVKFWVKWIRGGSRVPWREEAREFFNDPQKFFRDLRKWHLYTRFSYFFASLRVDIRNRYLYELRLVDVNDFLLCMNALTKKEEDEILKQYPHTLMLLSALLEWPWQRNFLETAEKLWNYVSESDFCSLIYFFRSKKFCRDFDYCELFCDFWDRSPISLRESAKQLPHISKEIDWWFNKIRRRRNGKSSLRDSENFTFGDFISPRRLVQRCTEIVLGCYQCLTNLKGNYW